MKRNQSAIGGSAAVLCAFLGATAFPNSGATGEDMQAERESRRLEDDLRLQQEMARREIDARTQAQADALRGQEEAIRRMEATRSRMEENIERVAQQSASQGRPYNYPSITVIALAPASASAPDVPAALPDAEAVRHDDTVSGMKVVPLSEQLGGYFGAKSGVLVVRAGSKASFGLQDGDVILTIDGRIPADEQHVADMLRSYRPGEHVKLKILRNRRTIEIDAAAPG